MSQGKRKHHSLLATTLRLKRSQVKTKCNCHTQTDLNIPAIKLCICFIKIHHLAIQEAHSHDAEGVVSQQSHKIIKVHFKGQGKVLFVIVSLLPRKSAEQLRYHIIGSLTKLPDRQ